MQGSLAGAASVCPAHLQQAEPPRTLNHHSRAYFAYAMQNQEAVGFDLGMLGPQSGPLAKERGREWGMRPAWGAYNTDVCYTVKEPFHCRLFDTVMISDTPKFALIYSPHLILVWGLGLPIFPLTKLAKPLSSLHLSFQLSIP